MLRELLPFIAVLPATAYSLISLACGQRYFRKDLQPSAFNLQPSPLGVTILKPVKGMDAGSYDNFASFCCQEYSGPVQLLFAAASSDDPVIPVIMQLMRSLPDMDIQLAVNPAIHGPNYKVSNLINAFPAAKYDIIIVCDSDIRVSPDYLASVTRHFDDPTVGLVTSLYRTSNVHGIATALEATGFTSEMIPNVMVALQLEGLSFALGASMAVRREALASIGGFDSLVDYLADDYQLGNQVHAAGWRIALDSCFVESMMKAESLRSVLSRQLRWARTMRVSRPGGYLASGITLPFPALVLAALLAPSAGTALLAIILLYGVRLTVACIFSRTFVGDRLLPGWLWLLLFRDMLAFFSWALSFLGNRVEWRGIRFRLKPGGKLEELV
ncbi:MAG: bacteriohopanetetrol glucosamine biosynthesis glycosyltransferase HpnI [Desulfuromonadales bacterium]|nr:bacteriohopanetetrol glucosamine biosynthesis glycosyltransferase HpnI [Desulfuromonadales bacterium]